MNTKLFLLLIALSVILAIHVNAQGIRFENESTTLEELLQKAKSENKIIFIYCYTRWCSPCKWMVKNVFTDDSVADFYSKNFICLKIDADRDEGQKICRDYIVTVFPNFLFLCQDGKIKHKEFGEMSAKEFIDIGKKALNPEIDITSLSIQYNDGNRDSDFLLLYLDELYSSNLPYKDVLNIFLKNQTDLFSKKSWMVIKKYLNDRDSEYFNFLLKNRNKFEALYGNEVKEKINGRSFIKSLQDLFADTRTFLIVIIFMSMALIGTIKFFHWIFLLIRLCVRKIKKLKKSK